MRASFLSLSCAALIAGAASVTVVACSGDEACNATTCPDGCCGADDVCRPNGPTSCGLAGAACDDCTARRYACVEGACQPYEQACLELNSQCLSDGQCCSEICSRGRCATERCRSGGAACIIGEECCSGTCDNGQCASHGCGLVGDVCSVSNPCCAQLQCNAQNVCEPSCKGTGAACTAATDCCNNKCVGGFCAPDATCKMRNESCINSNECCPGLTCDFGQCTQ